jgi:hypothetical protein
MERPLLAIRDISMDPQHVFGSCELAAKALSNKAASINLTHASLPLKALVQRVDFPVSAGGYPLRSLPDLSDCSTLSSKSFSTHYNGGYSEASSQYSHDHNGSLLGGVDVCDMIFERLESIFDLVRMDHSLVHQVRT